jgi:hypothetical protein
VSMHRNHKRVLFVACTLWGAGAASGAVNTYTQFSGTSPNGWYQDSLAISGAYYDPGTFSNFNTTTNTGGFGWETFTVSVANGTLSYVGGSLLFASTAADVQMDVLFTFSGGSNPPVGSNGIYGFGIDYGLTPLTSNWVGIGVNGASVSAGQFANGFAGVIANTTSPAAPVNGPIFTARFSFQSGTTVTITGTQYAIVPGPGSAALLAACAGLMRGRRRRC